MNSFTKQNRITDTENDLMVSKGECSEGYIRSMDLMYKDPYVKTR